MTAVDDWAPAATLDTDSPNPPYWPARPAWHTRAACRGADPEIFFPTSGGTNNEAVAYCNRCPVRADCLAYGLGDKHGIWGGTNEKQRRQLRRNRGAAPTSVPQPIRHGTEAGYRAHTRRGENPCAPCRDAARRAKNGRKNQQQGGDPA